MFECVGVENCVDGWVEYFVVGMDVVLDEGVVFGEVDFEVFWNGVGYGGFWDCLILLVGYDLGISFEGEMMVCVLVLFFVVFVGVLVFSEVLVMVDGDCIEI